MTEGVDYSFARPGGAALRAAGKSFAVRYVPYQGDGGKGLKSDELADLQANGIAVALVWETTAGRMLDGYGAGVTDGTVALASAALLGFPKDRPIYFACDTDTTADQLTSVRNYLDGAASVLGRARVGIYGEYDVIDHCLGTGAATWFWQTAAWSGGRLHPTAHLYQYLNDQTINGAAVDLCRSLKADFGQWGGDMPDTRVDAILRALTGRDGDLAMNRIAKWNTKPDGTRSDYSLLDGYEGHANQIAQLVFVTHALATGASPASVADALIAILNQYKAQQGAKP